MNGYDLSRNFVNFSFENPSKIKPNHYALYFFAIEHCNRLGWKKEYGLPTTMTMEAIGIKSYNTYIKTFNELVEYGFFNLIERSKNQYSANIIELSNNDKAPTKALDKAFIKHATKQLQSTEQSISSIDKPITNKPITTTKAEVDFNLNNNYKNNLVKDSFLLENFSRIFKTNIKTVLHYLEEFNTHLITTQEIKENQKEYQKHFSNWYNKKPRQTIKEQTRNLYKDLDKDL